MGIYALAFVAFAMDLADRGARKTLSAEVPSAARRRAEAAGTETVSVAGAGGATTTLTRSTGRAEEEARWGRRKTSRSLRVAFVLTSLGFVFHLAGVVLRGLAAGRVPWSDMWEFSIMGTVLMIAIFLLVNIRYDLRFLGAFMTGLVLLLLGIATVSYYVPVAPLPPALQSYWLVIHVTVAFLGTAFFAVGFALSGVQLLQTSREARIADGRPQGLRFLGTIPGAAALENLAYRTNIVGFILWTFTLIAGAIWAEKAWGRYWGWDTKEVWTFIIWVIYAGYIHARATRGWRGSRSAWLAIIGFSAVMFNFGIVNIFFHGLHSYSGLGS
ncbi:MAG: c-type cytochrome biogenesis protein CcsB [Microbacteriaceae bacterium]|nr:MAG: c-type cytochrome biogenesis protein CcsB [Microbacteriaceae bacterium]